MKYTRIIKLFSELTNLTLDEALDFFYHSELYELVSEGISDMHCMSDMYLARDLEAEYKTRLNP